MDMEKVIKGFECCMTDMNRSDSMPCRSCPYGTLPKKENCQKQMFADVYAMLKEQEIVRCKDCKWFHQAFKSEGRCLKHDNDYHELNWFCADGEKRNDSD